MEKFLLCRDLHLSKLASCRQDDNPPAVRIVRPSDSVVHFGSSSGRTIRDSIQESHRTLSLVTSQPMSPDVSPSPCPDEPPAETHVSLFVLLHSASLLVLKMAGMAFYMIIFGLAFARIEAISAVNLFHAIFHLCLSVLFVMEISIGSQE